MNLCDAVKMELIVESKEERKEDEDKKKDNENNDEGKKRDNENNDDDKKRENEKRNNKNNDEDKGNNETAAAEAVGEEREEKGECADTLENTIEVAKKTQNNNKTTKTIT